MNVWLVHGYNSRAGEGSIDRCKPHLERHGLTVNEFDYTWFNGSISGLFGAKFLNRRRTQRLQREAGASSSRPRVAIGHSNGCAILYRAVCEYPGLFSQCHFVNPALDNDVKFPSAVDVTVYHTPGEKPTEFATYIPWTLWGNMGSVGYCGASPRVENIDTSSECFKEFASSGHSDKFSWDKVAFWSAVFAARILKKYTLS